METSFRIEPARAEDMPRCVEIINKEFAFLEALPMFHGADRPENRITMGKAHFEMQRDHMSRFPSVPVCVKCVQTTKLSGGSSDDDDDTVQEKIVGYGEWYVFDRPRTQAEIDTPSYYESYAWIPNEEDQPRCRAFLAAGRAMRARLLGAAPYGQVRFLCVDAAHRRQGVGSAIVRWGMRRCAEVGAGMYEKLGFTEVVMPDGETSPHYTCMIWHPPVQEQ